MLSKDTPIFAGFHPDEENLVLPVLDKIRAAGWNNIDIAGNQAGQTDTLESIQRSGMVLIFLSRAFARDERMMLEKFAYAATVVRKPFIPVWLDSLADIQQDYKKAEYDQQLISALEMLTAKYTGTTFDSAATASVDFEKANFWYVKAAEKGNERAREELARLDAAAGH